MVAGSGEPGLWLISLRRMLGIVDLDGILVVSRSIAVGPSRLDGRQDRTTIVALVESKVRAGELVVVALGVVGAAVGSVPVVALKLLCAAPLSQLVARLVGNHLQDVGADVPAAQRGQVPVGRDGRDFRVVVVEAVVFGADQLLGHRVSDHDAENAVADRVDFALIPGNEDQGVLHECLVFQEGLDKVASPSSSSSDIRVMAVA